MRRISVSLFVSLGLVVAMSLTVVPGSPSAHAAESPVGLGNAGSFAVLGASTSSNTTFVSPRNRTR